VVFPRPRSPLARAVLPVLGGAVVLAAIFAATYGIAAVVSGRDSEPSTRLAPRTLPVGSAEGVAESIAERGPILFPGLNTTTGRRTLILDHEGADPTRGWKLYLGHAADGDASCGVTQVPDTRRFADCNGDELDITALARPTDACPIVESRQRIAIGLVSDECD
jgi:hypothetical protein